MTSLQKLSRCSFSLVLALASGGIAQVKLTAIDARAGDTFGNSVAVDGDTIVAGAPEDSSSRGSAYVFVRNGATWARQAKLTASDGAAGDLFGAAVAVSGDTIVVGAHGDDGVGPLPYIGEGSAYVFVRNGTTWTEQAKLTPSDGGSGVLFGNRVTVDGDTIVAGAQGDDDAGMASGAAYVFVRNGATWTEQAKLTAADGAGADFFGVSVAVSGDTVVAGARGDSDVGTASGSAYVFVRNGATWTQQAKLTASDAAANDLFGIGGGDARRHDRPRGSRRR